ncbi:MAG: hypothetical protein ACO1RT_06185, partial [Planctomycetaceae bacterium]
MLTPLENSELEPHLRRVMRDCRKLYAACGDLMVRRHPTLLGASVASFPELMEDLHRGLLVKIYATAVRGDGKWTRTEKFIGALLIEHIWNEHLRGPQLREASEKLFSQSDQLKWPALVGPFVRYEPLRDMVGQIETIVTRLANLIIKSDGLTTPEETATLLNLQYDLALALHPREPEIASTPAPSQPVALPGRGNGRAIDDCTRVSYPEKSAAERLAEAYAELDSLVGIESVKERVRSLSNFLQLQRTRQTAGLATMPISLHMAF